MDVRKLFEANAQRMRALYAGQDQTERYAGLADAFRAQPPQHPVGPRVSRVVTLRSANSESAG